MTALDLATDALAAFRLTRLVTRDDITEPLRHRVIARVGSDSLIAEGLTCDWCVGVYAAFVIRLLPRWVRRGLATAALVGLIAERE